MSNTERKTKRASKPTTRKVLKDKDAEIAKLREQIRFIAGENQKLAQRGDVLSAELRASNADLGTANRIIDQLRAQLGQLEKTANAKKTEPSPTR